MNRKLGVQVIALMTTFLFIFTTFAFIVQSVPPLTQETLIVDISGNGDYTSIEDAVKNASTTDIIIIREGIYNEYSINIKVKVEIIGEDSSNTIINCSGHPGLTLSSPYIDISNIQIINTDEYAIYITPESDGCAISNCEINVLGESNGINIK